MTKSELHYLNCQEPDCERVWCVGRRDFERRIANLIDALQKANDKIKDLQTQVDLK